MYSLSFKFFRLLSQPSFTNFLPCSFPSRFLRHLFLSLSLKNRRSLRHLDRCICASLRRFLRRTYVWKFLKMLTPGFIKYCMLRNIYWTCWLFGLLSPETWERSYCLRTQSIKTLQKLNIMRQIYLIFRRIFLKLLRFIILFPISLFFRPVFFRSVCYCKLVEICEGAAENIAN